MLLGWHSLLRMLLMQPTEQWRTSKTLALELLTFVLESPLALCVLLIFVFTLVTNKKITVSDIYDVCQAQ